MNNRVVIIIIVMACLFGCKKSDKTTVKKSLNWLDDYNVVWNSQSKNSSESMPCGGGDIGMNVWIENGDILFYVDRSGNIDENDQQRKTGRVRIKMTPSPFSTDGNDVFFEQKLDLKTGAIFITGKNADNGASIRIWSEVKNPVVHVDLDSDKPSEIKVAYESWRYKTQIVPRTAEKGRDYNRWASYGYCNYEGDVYAYADSISFKDNNAVLFYHQNKNEDLVFDKLVSLMRMDSVANKLAHPTKNRIFGGILKGDNLIAENITNSSYSITPFKAWNLKSASPSKKHHFSLELHTEQVESVDTWKDNLKKVASDMTSEEAWKQNVKWWSNFWYRSYIIINKDMGPEDEGWQVGRNYQLFRYMLACNAYREWPTRFNGGLFTYDPEYVKFNEYFDLDKNHDLAYYNPD